MARGKKHAKTTQWAARQNRDPYVNGARRAGFRARSAFKLAQIDRKYRLIKPASTLIDLGCAPGGWSQYAAGRIDAGNRLVAVDVRAMEAVAKVNFIRGDFTNEAVVEEIFAALNGRRLDLVLSDMAPNISGIRSADQARAAALQRAVVEFCSRGLRTGGGLLIKLFMGEAADAARKLIGERFERVRALKPDASRSASSEIYLLARGYGGGKNAEEAGARRADGVYWAPGAKSDRPAGKQTVTMAQPRGR